MDHQVTHNWGSNNDADAFPPSSISLATLNPSGDQFNKPGMEYESTGRGSSVNSGQSFLLPAREGHGLTSSTQETDQKKAPPPSILFFQKPTGWRLGLTWATLFTFIILVVNITLAATFTSGAQTERLYKYVAVIRSGECGSIKRYGLLVHLAINVVSTLLVGASNYSMQTLSAPTREDINYAHGQGKWVDIGVPSVRNLLFIRKRRTMIWLLLGLTSIPLHFVYNSVFFVSTNNSLYKIWYASENFVQGAEYGEVYERSSGQVPINSSIVATLQEEIMRGGTYEKLSNEQCIREYAKTLVEDRGDVVLVIDPPTFCGKHGFYGHAFDSYGATKICANTSVYGVTYYDEYFAPASSDIYNNWYGWICSQDFNNLYIETQEKKCVDGAWKEMLQAAESWRVSGARVNYCLSERRTSKCYLKVASNLLYLVITMNAIKLMILLGLIATRLVNQDPIVTVGDAAATFIESSEPMTKGACLDWVGYEEQAPIIYQPTTKRLYTAASLSRWILASLITMASLITVLGFLGKAVSSLKGQYSLGGMRSLWNLGVGQVTPYTLIKWVIPDQGDSSVLCIVLIANLPQFIFSFQYFLLNGLFTSMAAAAEWASYGFKKHRPLRVSFPKAKQRSTFFLQLPYRYSVPLIAFSILMHWLISQSIFMVQILEQRTYEDLGDTAEEKARIADKNTTTTAAFSPMAMIFLCVTGTVVSLGAAVLGALKLKGPMPLAGSCSLAISAACHVPKGTSSLKPLKWGVVERPEETHNGLGHCSFSNGEVDAPEPGKMYT